jgi:ribosomal protein RSM22 (predicted rRNA methylase)
VKLSDLLPHLLHAFKSESDLVRAIEEISLKFTKERDSIGDYLQDPRLVSAYAAFYLSTNLPKLATVTQWLTEVEREELKQFELIDVGAGPGTFSLAWRELVGTKSAMIETSKLMREQAMKFYQGLHHEEALFKPELLQQKKLLLFGHSLNEMGVEAGLEYIKKYNPEKIWLLEPGTKQSFALALKLRESLIAQKWQVRFPCLGQAECPMKNTDDWCHQYLHVTHDPQVERLTQLASRDRRHLPMTVMMFQREARVAETEQLARIVRVFPQTKFSHEWQVCLSTDSKHQLRRVELPFKLNSKTEKRMIESYTSGQLIEFSVEKELSDRHRIRIKI